MDGPGNTAAEIVFERADAQKPFMGLTSFSGDFPALKDIGIAKNYLQENELKILNNLLSYQAVLSAEMDRV